MNQSLTQTRQRAADWILIVLFLVLIALPLAASLAGWGVGDATAEKRQLAGRPRLSWRPADLRKFPAAFEKYFNDHFAFRRRMIRAYNWGAIRWLRMSPSERVILGRNGWLFYNSSANKDGDEIADCRRLRLLSVAQLERGRREWEAQQQWLAARKIRFLLVVAPNKSTVYREFVPEYLTPVGAVSVLDQFLGYMRTNSTEPVLDLRPALLAAKAQGLVYRLTDSHWNERGAWIAYGQIIHGLQVWFPQLKPKAWDDFELHLAPASPGWDLANMLDLPDVLREDNLWLIPRRPRQAAIVAVPMVNALPDAASDCPDTALPRAVFFRDSFAEALIPYLAEHFQHAYYRWGHGLDQALIDRERPEVVVVEMVERYLRVNLQ